MRRISSLPLSLRPRERLLKYGVEALKTEELVSVVLVTGTRAKTVSSLSTGITKLAGQTNNLTKEKLFRLGVGPTKTAQILAALELGKRCTNQLVVPLLSPEEVYAHSFDIIKREKESLLCFYLNARGELLTKEILAVGSLNRASLLPREIFSVIKDLPVASIILAHNHPSGTLEPSMDDILFTRRVKRAGDILGVKLLDHLIVSEKGWKRIRI